MMKDRERRVEIKKVIEENPRIHHTLLLAKIAEKKIGSKRTVERTITQLLESGEIVSFRAMAKKCYALVAHEMYRGDMSVLFTGRIEAIKKELDTRVKRMEEHSYESQELLYGQLCKGIESDIAESDRRVEALDGEARYDHGEISRSILERMEETKIDTGRRRRIRGYAERVVMELERLDATLYEMEKKKRSMRVSEEKDEVTEEMKQIDERKHDLYDDALNIEHALGSLRSLDVRFWHDDTEVGSLCFYLGSAREDSTKNTERMSSILQKLKEIAAKRAIPISTGRLDKQISEIKKSLVAAIAIRSLFAKITQSGVPCHAKMP